jgi:aspartyl-tRNA(Asn)/glutamyl-tRNA(Gln) amidotransferase subunit C
MPGMSAEPASITLDDVRHLALLARIDLDDEHLARLRGQLDQILHAVAQVTEVAGTDVPPTSHPLPLTNVSRQDVLAPCLTAEEALSAAPATEDGRFRVPRILEEEA